MYLSLLSLVAFASAALAQHSLKGTLSNGNANTITKNLFNFIVSNYGKHTLSGQQDINSYKYV